MLGKYSVVICTYNRATHLKAALESLLEHYRGRGLDIIVVDNNSTDSTREIAAAYQQWGVRYLSEPNQGHSHARNRGLNAAEHDIVIYLDDDVTVRADWLEQLTAPFAEAGVAVVGGELEPVWEQSRPRWLTDRWLHSYSVCLRWSGSPRRLKGREWLCEANIAFRRAPLVKAGGFPTHLGRIGDGLLSGGGVVIERIRYEGGEAIFAPHAIADHHIGAPRLTSKWLMRRVFWQGVTSALIEDYRIRHLHQAPPPQTWRDLRLPVNHQRWAAVFNGIADVQFDAVLKETYDLGYALRRVGLLGELSTAMPAGWTETAVPAAAAAEARQ
jgi:glycosyltransferase involved in cell wall biosynthesis